MSSRRILQAIKTLFFVAVIGTPLFYFKWGIYPYVVPKTAFFEVIVELLFFLWLALAIKDRRYRPKMTPLLWGMAAFLVMLTIASLLGVDPWRSFFSSYVRALGVVAIYHLAALALVASALKTELPWKKIWYSSFSVSILTVILAALQLKIQNLLLVEVVVGRAGATFGNPTFLAGYLLFNIFIAGYYLLARRAGHAAVSAGEMVFLAATIAVGAVGIFITQTRGDILGLFAGILALIALFVVRPPETGYRLFRLRAFYGVLFSLSLVLVGGIWFTRTNPVWSGVPGLDRLKNISLASDGENAPRLIAFGAAWKGFLDRPLTGWGPDNFNVVSNKYYDPHVLEYGYGESDFDKPHNVPLEELATGGIGLFLAYFAVLILLVREAWKTKDRPLFQIVVALMVAYVVRSLVIFDTIGPLLMFYLLIGFIPAAHEPAATPNMGKDKSRNGEKVSPAVLVAAAIPAAILIYALNISTLYASYHAYLGHLELQIEGNTPAAMADFRTSVDTWEPNQWEFTRDYANTLAQAYFYDHNAVPKDDMLYALAKMQQVAADHPQDAYNHYLLTDIYNLISDIDPQKYLAEAEAQGKIALDLSPDRQEVLFYLAKTKSLEGDNGAALAVAKTALDLDPKVPDSHFYYGMLAFAVGKQDVGYAEVKAAMAMGRPWNNFYEPRVAGDYFADAGHLPEAIDLYRTALAMQPGDLESEIKLGAAYFLNGENDKARPYLADAASRFDFRQSPQYLQYKAILDALGIPLNP
jgi:O-antigen ligase